MEKDSDAIKEIKAELKRRAEAYRQQERPDARKFLKETDELTREYYRLRHPELQAER